jgi:hypothetical protein
LLGSGLYADLAASGALVPHTEVPGPEPADPQAYKVIRPEPIPFISHPFEWCFSQLRDAALLTLRIQERALESGMCLKDASAYNIQFRRGRPILIDTLSFEKYREGQAWPAYRQFCQHFLAPLALMSKGDARLGSLSRIFLDGVPLDLASSLLPKRTWAQTGLLLHIHLHAKSQRAFSRTRLPGPDAPPKPKSGEPMRMGKASLIALLASLGKAVAKLACATSVTEWGNYYADNSYAEASLEAKHRIVAEMLRTLRPARVWDMGANSGAFSRIASGMDIETLAFDLDHSAVEANYLRCRDSREANLLPLVLDLVNPSPAMGWANRERQSLEQRGPADVCLVLALIHHLALSNNLPFSLISEWLHKLGRHLIIEFVPKSDPQVRRLLETRPDIFPDYHEAAFLTAFAEHFLVRESLPVTGSDRKLFLLQARPA